MEHQYDIVIIGSGMGGLVSAILLAKEGKKVCVLEKNNQYGGNLQTFVREKTIFDTGVHYIGGLAPGQNLYHYFSYIGIMDDIPLMRMDKDAYDYILFGDDTVHYPHAQGYSNFVNQLAEYFPEERENITRYCEEIRLICHSFPLYEVKEEGNYNEALLSKSLRTFLDEITQNEALKCVLAGSNALYAGHIDTTPLYVHSLTVNSYIESAWRCIKGGSQITKLLIRQLRKFGGDIKKKTEVCTIRFNEEGVESVVTKAGNLFKAKQFISDIDLNSLFSIGGDQLFRKSFRNRIQRLEVTPSSFSIHIALKPNSFHYQNHNYYYFDSKELVWKISKEYTKGWPSSYMISMGVNSPNSSFADSLSVMTYMGFDSVKEWENTVNTVVDKNERGKAYEKFKEKHAQLLINKVSEKFPQLKECIQGVYATTPLTYRDYIGSKQGNMYGFIKDAKNPMKTFISPRTKIKNFFLTGQTINMHGIMGVTIGAVNTCSEIIGRSYLINKIKNEVNVKKS